MNEVRKVTLPSELAESGTATPYSSEGKEYDFLDSESLFAPSCISATTVQLPP